MTGVDYVTASIDLGTMVAGGVSPPSSPTATVLSSSVYVSSSPARFPLNGFSTSSSQSIGALLSRFSASVGVSSSNAPVKSTALFVALQ